MKYLILVLILISTQVSARTIIKVDLDPIFEREAAENNVSLSLLRAICWVESSHNQRVRIVMDAGSPSYGICQVKFATAQHLGYIGSARNLINPETNIHWSAKVLSHWLNRFNGNWKKAATAYNRGHYYKNMSVCNRYVIKLIFAMHEKR